MKSISRDVILPLFYDASEASPMASFHFYALHSMQA